MGNVIKAFLAVLVTLLAAVSAPSRDPGRNVTPAPAAASHASAESALGYPAPPDATPEQGYPFPWPATATPGPTSTPLVCDFEYSPCVCAEMPGGAWTCWRVEATEVP